LSQTIQESMIETCLFGTVKKEKLSRLGIESQSPARQDTTKELMTT